MEALKRLGLAFVAVVQTVIVIGNLIVAITEIYLAAWFVLHVI